MLTLRKAAVAAATFGLVIGLAGAAAAADPAATPYTKLYNLGTLTPDLDSTVSTNTVGGGQTAVYDFTFNVDQAFTGVETGTFSVSNPANVGFQNASLELFEGTPCGTPGCSTGATALQYIDVGNLTSTYSYTFTQDLSPSTNYFIQATGTVPKGYTGNLTVAATVKAISKAPEPSTWLLMMLGVGGLGLAMRRRQGAGAFLAA